MSASTETTSPAQRMKITTDPTPMPPWTGLTFTCEGVVRHKGRNRRCGAKYTLEAADRPELRLIVSDKLASYNAPPCWDCGHVNVIECAPPNDRFEGAGL